VSGIGRRRAAARDEPSEAYTLRREALVRAAADVFRKKGYEAVRMDDVAEALGVDRATLYYYFRNKHQLFLDVISEPLEANLREANAIAASDGAAMDKLQAIVESLLISYERYYPLLYVYVQEDMRKLPATDDSDGTRRLNELGSEYENAVKRVIKEGIESGEFDPNAKPTLVAYAILGAVNWSHRWFHPDGGMAAADIGRVFADTFLDGLLVGDARRRRRSRSSARQVPR